MTNALKTIAKTDDELTVANYIVMFGGRDVTGAKVKGYNTGAPNPDGSTGEYFSPETRVKSAYTEIGQFPVDWEHGMTEQEGEPGRDALGYVNWKSAKVDETGWFVERVLFRRNKYIQALEEAGLFEAGFIGTSSEADPLRAKVLPNGQIAEWPLIKDTLTVQPFDPRMISQNALQRLKALSPDLILLDEEKEENEMSDNTQNEAPAVDLSPVLDAIKGVNQQVKAFGERLDAVENKPTNDPGPVKSAPTVIADTSHWQYDNIAADDLAIAIGVLETAKHSGQSRRGANIAAIKALGMRLESEEGGKTEPARKARQSFKALGMKANEIGQSTLANFGDEWVGVFYSGSLWESIRHETAIVNRIPSFEVPQGAESVVIPLEGTDPTWYKVAQSASLSADPGGIPTNTVTSSKLGTAQKVLTLGKMGARVLWTGELEEDSVLPYVQQLRRQLAVSAAEHMESAVIDGDTATGATTNINKIEGTPGGSEYWLLVDGFRKLALVTNTANARDGGTLTSSDFLETIKLMGVGGSNADLMRTAFIIPWAMHWKALELADVKTRDVFNGATIEDGRLAAIYGYPIYVSHHMHKPQASRLTEATGKIDLTTASDNTKSAILSVRFDQWQLGWRRRMTLETTRIPAADATEIVALMRWGMVNRDNEASAISYNMTV